MHRHWLTTAQRLANRRYPKVQLLLRRSARARHGYVEGPRVESLQQLGLVGLLVHVYQQLDPTDSQEVRRLLSYAWIHAGSESLWDQPVERVRDDAVNACALETWFSQRAPRQNHRTATTSARALASPLRPATGPASDAASG